MSDCECVKENPGFFRRLFANTALDGVCKMELKMRITHLEMEKEKLAEKCKKQEEQIRFLSDALMIHSCSIHVNDDAGSKLFERMKRARADRDTYRSKFLGEKPSPMDYT